MDAKTPDILNAAKKMFVRYGFAKTTMSDIAEEAGVARQTVYNAFGSKEDILRAVVRQTGKESLDAVLAEWSRDLTLDEKLAAFQRLGPQAWYETMQSTPDFGELVDGINRTAAAEHAEIEVRWIAEIEALLSAHMTAPAGSPEPREIAAFFFSASKNAKYGVKDAAELRKRLDTIRDAALALVGRQS